jgi:hypothetical protein
MRWLDRLLGRRPREEREVPVDVHPPVEPGDEAPLSAADEAEAAVDELRDENYLGAPREYKPPGTG